MVPKAPCVVNRRGRARAPNARASACVLPARQCPVRDWYETGTIILTSNRPFSKWAELMSDEAVATAMLDRLLHHAQVFSLKADSYRMKERLRVGAVGFD